MENQMEFYDDTIMKYRDKFNEAMPAAFWSGSSGHSGKRNSGKNKKWT